MSDAVLRAQSAPLRESRDALSDVLIPIVGLEADDNSVLGVTPVKARDHSLHAGDRTD